MSQNPQSPSAESQVLSLCSTLGITASAVDASLVSRLADVLKTESGLEVGCSFRLNLQYAQQNLSELIC